MLIAERNGIRCSPWRSKRRRRSRLAGNVFDTGLGNGDARFLREGQCDRFPDHRVGFIVLAWEFRDGETAVLSLTEALGLAPPREEPGANNMRSSSSVSFSSITGSAAESSFGSSISGCERTLMYRHLRSQATSLAFWVWATVVAATSNDPNKNRRRILYTSQDRPT